MSKLAHDLEAAMEGRSVYTVAMEWGVPPWVLRDTMSGKVDCPSSKYLRQVARGLGVSVEEVIDAAYASAVA